jgi:hypothetical protein
MRIPIISDLVNLGKNIASAGQQLVAQVGKFFKDPVGCMDRLAQSGGFGPGGQLLSTIFHAATQPKPSGEENNNS